MSSNSNSSSYINDEDKNRLALESLFSFSKKPNEEVPKPYRKRNLPYSFYHPPCLNTKNKNVNHQHTKNQLSLPDTSLHTTHSNNYLHSRTVSDTAALTRQTTTNAILSNINSQSSVLPLPDGWEERQNSNGQIYYIDHITKYTTWTDPRPKHYAAFQSYCATLPLPDGYQQKCDTKGNIYFINHKYKKTYWDDPRPNYYRSLMTKRFDIPSSSSQQDSLANKLTEILKERQALQLRTQELERMEIDIRKKLNHQDINTNNQILNDQTTIESFIDDLFHHKRQDSADSGLDDDLSNINETIHALSSMDFPDDLLLPNSSSMSNIRLSN